MQSKKIYRLGQVARMYGVPVGWLKEQVEARKIPAVRAGRVYLLRPEIVESFLLKQAEGSAGE